MSIKMVAAGMEVCPSTRNPAAKPPLQTLLMRLDCTALLHPSPRCVAVHPNPVHGALKKTKKVALSPAGSISLQWGKNPTAFRQLILCGQVIPALALSAWEPSLHAAQASLFSERSSHGHASTLAASCDRVLAPFVSLTLLPVSRLFLPDLG